MMSGGVAVKVERSSDEELQRGIFSYLTLYYVIIIHPLLTDIAGPSPKKPRVEPQFDTGIKVEESKTLI